ncbi:MAG: tRNA pseudouridine(55) synthase TruB [Desulfobacterium sp.]|jgi:tRNA pseudouridine55 synthase|nr:tRNA pseudouridine(55) synthase TruB [Desulfobacterium sp.]
MNSGILAVDKPGGISSARLVARIKQCLKAKKVGHTGTLDPFATGVMLCGINQGTRISRFLLGGPKKYTATLCLGVETDTLDRTGIVEKTADPSHISAITRDELVKVVDSFAGVQMQHPPIFSALKHEGQPLYRLARQGKPVQKPMRRIEIFSIAITGFDLPYLTLDVHCSTGTYVRSLAQDIGSALGCGAHLAELRRTDSCGFSQENLISLTSLEAMDHDEARSKIIPMNDALWFMPAFEADPGMVKKIGFGQGLGLENKISPPGDGQEPFVRIVAPDGSLAAVVEYDPPLERYNYCCVFVS